MKKDFRGAVLVPTERPPSSIDVKRALLLFDHVTLLSPSDREFIDPAAYTGMLMPVPFMLGLPNQPPVLPLGKVSGYDETYRRLIKDLRSAEKDGAVVVEPPAKLFQGFTIGGVPGPDSWANPQYLRANFHFLVGSESVLRQAAKGVGSADSLLQQDLDALAPGGRGLDRPPNMQPLPTLNDGSLPTEVGVAVQRLAAARLGSLIKCIGIAEVTGRVPYVTDAGLVGVLDHIQNTASTTLAKEASGERDEEDIRRMMRVERIIFESEGSELKLAKLSIDDVLKLRTQNWGKAKNARAELVKAVRKIALDAKDDTSFDKAVRKSIADYEKAASDGMHELTKLGLKVAAPVLTHLATMPIQTIVAAAVGLPSWELTLALGAFATWAEKIGPDGWKAFRDYRNRQRHPGKALLAPYKGAR